MGAVKLAVGIALAASIAACQSAPVAGDGGTSGGTGGGGSTACVITGSCYGAVACPVGSVCELNTFTCCEYHPTDGGGSSGGSGFTPHPATGCPAETIPASLDGLAAALPCQPHTGIACRTVLASEETAVIQGLPGEQYQVALQFWGAVEPRDYGIGGTDAGLFVDGGSYSTANDYNVFELQISSPGQTYFLNNGTQGSQVAIPLDYQETFPVNSGATVSLTANSVDYVELANLDRDGGPVNIPGEPAAYQNYDGQFIVMNVLSLIDEGPAAGGPSGGPSCAVANGGCAPFAACTEPDAGQVTCACPAGFVGDGCSCENASSCALEDLAGGFDVRLDLPCGTSGSSECSTSQTVGRTFTVGKAGSGLLDLNLHVRGLVEEKTYQGGQVQGLVNAGGTPAPDAYDTFSIAVSSPAQTYYLNNGASGGYPGSVDYDLSLVVAGGAQVTFSANTIDGLELKNLTASGAPASVAGLPPFPAAYNGQFLQIDVDSVAALDGGSAVPSDCQTANGGCDPTATCSSAGGLVSCSCPSGSGGDGCSCFAVGGNLTGLRWEEPCVAQDAGACLLDAGTPVVQTVAMSGGAAGQSYQLTFHFRGVVEEKSYFGVDGGADAGLFVTGATPVADSASVYELDISAPVQTYYLNNGTSNLGYCVEADYLATVTAQTGATFTLTVNPSEAVQVANQDIGGNVIGVDGVPPYPQTYGGQFLQMDLVGVAPGP